LIGWLLRQAEVSPAFTFTEHVLREAGDFERALHDRLVTRIAVGSLPCELVLDGRRVAVVEAPNGELRGYTADPPHERVALSHADLDRWGPKMPTIVEWFRARNGLAGAHAELHPRVHLLGTVEASGDAILLALLDSAARARVLLPSISVLLPSRYERILVFCPTYEPEPLLAKTLEASRVFIRRLPADDPLHLDLSDAKTAAFAFEKHRKNWNVTFDGGEVVVRDVRGMEYIWRLLAQPDVELLALSLQNGTPEASSDFGDTLLDATALQSARARARELQERLDDPAVEANPLTREAIRDELETLVDRLQRDSGLHGKSRRFSDEAERARVSVAKAIQRALKTLENAQPEAASLLSTRISTGIYCVYRSVPGISWRT